MAITAALVKELRERSGAGMMDCKKALTETNGDIEAALDLMRASGAAKAAKKAGRIAAEGLVKITTNEDNSVATILEVNCETDFVAKGDEFQNFVNKLGDLSLSTKPSNIDDFMNESLDGKSLEKVREDIVAKIGENISIRRVATINADGGIIGAYKHGEKIAVVTILQGGDESLAKDISMHIAASKPECVKEADIPADLIEREKAIFVEQARESGKPDDIIEKMIVGKMKKFAAEVTLEGQSFVKDPDLTVAQLLKNNNASVVSFTRYEVGEGIEKKEDNFVEEVMAQAKGE